MIWGVEFFFILKSTEIDSDKNEALTTLFRTRMSQIPLCDFCWQVLIESAQTEQFEAKGPVYRQHIVTE